MQGIHIEWRHAWHQGSQWQWASNANRGPRWCKYSKEPRSLVGPRRKDRMVGHMEWGRNEGGWSTSNVHGLFKHTSTTWRSIIRGAQGGTPGQTGHWRNGATHPQEPLCFLQLSLSPVPSSQPQNMVNQDLEEYGPDTPPIRFWPYLQMKYHEQDQSLQPEWASKFLNRWLVSGEAHLPTHLPALGGSQGANLRTLKPSDLLYSQQLKWVTELCMWKDKLRTIPTSIPTLAMWIFFCQDN